MLSRLPLIVLAYIGERADLHPRNVGVLIQHMDVVVRRDPDDRGTEQLISIHIHSNWYSSQTLIWRNVEISDQKGRDIVIISPCDYFRVM